ncbi:hypothetical protein CGI80_05035 [Vibrio parahaemolyticus]|uniref:hypothetical protein n=1 Tax=Gammaproteobacteria TaxID=1236 RepID=UPI00111F5F91|nr:hypothetical protein [Vibrio parahaemolyticus]TOH52864.1 hypothetical protein CGI80_05035 [Vibrio parahaemolyticus]
MKKIIKEDLQYEALLWALNKHNKYKITGKPDEAAKIYHSFIKYLDGNDVDNIKTKHDDYVEFLRYMFNDYRAIEFAKNHLIINI